jgi:hypothetical protein
MSPVKKISCLRSQDKKAPKSSIRLTLHIALLITSPHKEISHLKSNKFDDKTFFNPFNTFSVSES